MNWLIYVSMCECTLSSCNKGVNASIYRLYALVHLFGKREQNGPLCFSLIDVLLKSTLNMQNVSLNDLTLHNNLVNFNLVLNTNLDDKVRKVFSRRGKEKWVK